METETTFVNADRTLALLLPAEQHHSVEAPLTTTIPPGPRGPARQNSSQTNLGVPRKSTHRGGAAAMLRDGNKQPGAAGSLYHKENEKASLAQCQDIPLMAITVFVSETNQWVTLPLPHPYPRRTAALSQPFFLVCMFVREAKQALQGPRAAWQRRRAVFLTLGYGIPGEAKAIEEDGRNKRVIASVPHAWAATLSMLVTASLRKCPVSE